MARKPASQPRSEDRLVLLHEIKPPARGCGRCVEMPAESGCLVARSSDRTRMVNISRAVPNIKSEKPAETRDFFVDLLGFEVAMDLGWVVTVVSPTNPSAQVTIV